MVIATLFFLMVFALFAFGGPKDMPARGHTDLIVLVLLIFGLLSFFSGYLAIRLWSGSLSANGISVMPTWFIQVFGIFMAIGLGFAAYQQNSVPMLGGTSIVVAMIFFGSHVAKRKREQTNRK